MNIQKGKYFIHPQHGVGRVRSIRERSFGGHAAASYVELFFERDELTLTLLEKDLPERVRALVSREQALELLDRIETWDGRPAASWKARANAHQAAIDSGDPYENVKVLKGLAQLESEGALRSRDREHMNRSMGLLTDELACALKKTPGKVRQLIDRAIGLPQQAGG